MDRYLVVRGKFVKHRYGGYVRHDAAKDEIEKRDAMIVALKAQLSEQEGGK